MSESESILLERFIRGNDAGAFAEIVRRHAGLVYGTCLRVLADADKAADATQETFFQLLKKADEITDSIPGWLHRVAVGKAVDLVRSDSRRRQREQQYAGARSGSDATWREVCPYVDEALDRLDDQTRAILVGHFLEGRSMTAMAEEMGVSRQTVSRGAEAGLAQLRIRLHRRGITLAAAGLGVLLTENAAQSAPAWLIPQLGKVSLLGAEVALASGSGGAASSASLISGGVLAAANTKLVVAVSAVVVVGAGLLTYTISSRPPQASEPTPVVARNHARRQPRPNARPEPARPQAVEPETVQRGTPPRTVAQEAPPRERPADLDESTPELSEPPVWSDGAASGFQLDLSSPEATVRSFTKAFVLGDAESVLACWFESAGDYEDIELALEAGPDDLEYYEGKVWFQSLDPDAEMPIVQTREIEGGVQLVWRVTLRKDATMGGRTYYAGDTEEIEVTVRPSGDSWLIDNM
ncbi:MAG: sigma-70 family RNA polymerase sigma factor [Phycisphaerales bacterium]|nr:MAG: sigma-70 family RNA polymerase sigma factor [Phycisphaerales bacterium]